MRKFILSIIFLQGVLMSAVLNYIEVEGVKVPVIFEKDRNLPIADLQIVFRKSGSIEDGNLSGLAKMSAKMLAQGTKKDGNIGFAKKLEERAIRFGVVSGTETMVVEVGALKSEFDRALELLQELFCDPNLTPQALKNVKTSMLGFLARKKNDYDYIASKNLKKLLFADTPLANPSDGSEESIQKISLDDIKAFLHKHLVLKRAIVVAGGDIEYEELAKKLKDLLTVLPKGESEELPFYNASDAQREFVQKEQEIQQAYIYFGAPYYERVDSKDLYISKVAMFILGSGGFGSRLMEEIRVKRGLAYSAYSMSRINKSHSYFFGYLQTKLQSADEAKKLVKEVIADFVAKGATQKELESAKKFLLGSEPLRNETLSQRLSRAFHEFYTGKPLGSSREDLKKIESLSLQELNSFIKKHQEITKLSFSIVTK